MSKFLYKLKKRFNLKYWLKKFINRLIWIFGCCALMLVAVPSQKAFARSSYNYYRGDLNYKISNTVRQAVGIYTRDDYMIYQINQNSLNGSLWLFLNDGILRGSYNRMVVSIWSVENSDEASFSYFPTGSALGSGRHDSVIDVVAGSAFHYDNVVDTSGGRRLGFSVLFDLSNVSPTTDISSIWFGGSGTIPECYVTIYLFNDTGSNDISALINAVNLQTSILDNSIQNGNGQTQGTINGSDSELESTKNDFDDMNDKLNQYDDIESGFISDFDDAMNGIESTVNNFKFDGILSSANWLSTQMTSRYNVMGDFKFFVIFPVIFAIALIMIGGSIGRKF